MEIIVANSENHTKPINKLSERCKIKWKCDCEEQE